MAHKKSYADLLNRASEYRGKVINETIYLEKTIDTYIATYFCDDKLRMSEMHFLFLGDNRMTFESKKQIFDYLCKKHDLEWYKSYQSKRKIKIGKDTIQMIIDLDYIIQERNVLAHCFLDTSLEAKTRIDGKLTFLRFKNDKKPFEYTGAKYLELMTTIYNVTNHIIDKLNKVSKSAYHPLNVNLKDNESSSPIF